MGNKINKGKKVYKEGLLIVNISKIASSYVQNLC